MIINNYKQQQTSNASRSNLAFRHCRLGRRLRCQLQPWLVKWIHILFAHDQQ